MNDQTETIANRFPKNQDTLLAVLAAAQREMQFLSPQAIREIGKDFGLTDNEVYSMASFYPHFHFAPAQAGTDSPQPHLDGGDPTPLGTLDAYLADGGFEGLSKALRLSPEALEADIQHAGLGEGDGMDPPLNDRWRHCRQSRADRKFMIVHAAAAEAGAPDLGYLMGGHLYPVLEGMLIAAYAAGAGHGILCIDSRYADARPVLERACQQMQEAGYVGTGILGSDFNFKVDVKLVPGPVPWGAGSRLIAALEGRRIVPCGQPAALHGFPTNIHAPETLRQLSAIIRRGADWYAGLGVNGHKGMRLITLGGAVRKAGYYDVPMGTALRDIVNGFGNGVPDGETLKAVQVGGPTGGWIPAQALDIPLDPQALNTAGASLGPGMVTVVTQDACAPDLARQALVYASEQSCGHCLFCREGTRQMAQILTDITNGVSQPEDLDVLAELAEGVKLNSACRLGRTAPNAFLSTLRYFSEEYDAHLKEKCCPAGVCGIG